MQHERDCDGSGQDVLPHHESNAGARNGSYQASAPLQAEIIGKGGLRDKEICRGGFRRARTRA